MAQTMINPWRLLGRWFAIILTIFILSLIFGCTTKELPSRGELFDQRVAFRSSFPEGVTNRFCEEFSGGKCVRWNIIEYNLMRPEVRAEFYRLKFVCNVAGERYIISKDFAGLERWTLSSVFKKKKLVGAYYLPRDNQLLVNSQAWCGALESIHGRVMFL